MAPVTHASTNHARCCLTSQIRFSGSTMLPKYSILKSWMRRVCPGNISFFQKNQLLFLRGRGIFFQFFRIFLFHNFFRTIFENQHNVVQSIRFILEIFSRDPKDFSIYFQTVSPLHFPLQSNIGLIGVLSSVNRLAQMEGILNLIYSRIF